MTLYFRKNPILARVQEIERRVKKAFTSNVGFFEASANPIQLAVSDSRSGLPDIVDLIERGIRSHPGQNQAEPPPYCASLPSGIP